MHWNRRGEYQPIEPDECLECSKGCSFCLEICPAYGEGKNESEIGLQYYGNIEGIRFTQEAGYALSAFAGYSMEHRCDGASGGMATFVLETLLSTGQVDTVIAVGRVNEPGNYFAYKICQTVAEVRSCSRSAYYPVEISQVIKHILSHDGRYAVIGLPCVCKGIRLAQDKIPRLRQRIKFVFGLTCGHQSSRFFAEYVCALSHADPDKLKEVVFRVKEIEQPASNFAIKLCIDEGGKQSVKKILWKDGVGQAYVHGYFQLPGCFHCDDVFAECADAVFMDAWLPEYVQDPRGTSLVVVRSQEIDQLIDHFSKISLDISSLDLSRVISSQRNVLNRKQIKLLNVSQPRRRKKKKGGFILDRMIATLMYKISIISGNYWNRDIEDLHLKTAGYQNQITRLYRLRSFVSRPVKFVLAAKARIR